MIQYKSKFNIRLFSKLFFSAVIAIVFFIFSHNDARATVSNLGLIGYWSFNEGTTTIATDYSGNGNKGTLTNMANPPTTTSGWTNNGKRGRALNFDGVNDFLDVPNIALTGAATLAVWVKTNNNAQTSVIWGGTGSSQGGGPKMGMVSGTFFVSFVDGLGTVTLPTVGKWHLWVVTRAASGGAELLYIDNAAATALSTESAGTFTLDKIGASGLPDVPFTGQLDDARVYNRALSAAEVLALYNSGYAKFIAPNNNGLIGYWSFNEGTTTIATDYSGNGNKGTLTNMANPPTTTSGWTNNGKRGRALNFDGVDDFVNAGTNASLGITGDLTISAWVKASSITVTANEGPAIAGKYIAAANSRSYLLYITESSNTPTFLFSSDGNFNAANAIQANTAISTNQWYHLSATYSTSGTVKIYINGVLDKTATGLSTSIFDSTTNSNFNIGRQGGAVRFFNGRIDDVRVYNRGLSASEVAALYNSEATRYIAPNNNGLIGYWSFNEGTTTIATDYSGNGNKGRLTNMANPPTTTSGWTNNGKRGRALNFDGTNDKVIIGDPRLYRMTNADKVTMSVWFKTTFRDASVIRSLFNSYNFVNSYFNLGYNNGKVIFDVRDSVGSSPGVITSTVNSDNGKWHMATGILSGDAIYLYVDGVRLVSAVRSAGNFNEAQNWKIGGDTSNANEFFSGTIDEVRLYKRALAEPEVRALYQAGSTRYK